MTTVDAAHTSIVSPVHQRLLEALSDDLHRLDAHALRRHLTTLEAIDAPRVRVAGSWRVCWCSNDYLGLSSHPALAQAASEAIREWGLGARASRLLAGTTRWHQALEASLAAWFGAEEAIVYPSGYLANLGTLGALLGPTDVVLIDRLAHASLVDAARLSRARLRVFRHNDVTHAAHLLSRSSAARRRVIVTEGVFSMEGDRSPLAELLEVAERSDALVYVDDAHGAFVLGETGRGAPEAAGVAHSRLLYMATLGKALGTQGGFVVGPRPLIEWLRNRSRAFIYSTALSVPVAAASTAALQVLSNEPHCRAPLRQRVGQLHERLCDAGLVGKDAIASHIVPIVLGDSARALRVAEALWERGIWAAAIRPPTVPRGGARLRLSLTALHTEAHLDELVGALREMVRRDLHGVGIR